MNQARNTLVDGNLRPLVDLLERSKKDLTAQSLT